jgi:hypothetical protein
VNRSEVEPESGVSKKASECKIFPELGVSLMTFWGNFPVLEILSGGCSRENLTSISISVNLQEHELAGFFLILHLSDQRKVIGVHVMVSIDGRLVGNGVLGLIVASVENTSYFS